MAFVGTITNIHSVCSTYHWLNWVCKAPAVVISIVQGFASSVLLVVLFMLVPIIMRILARMEGIPQKTGVELSLMDRYFMFQVIVRGLVLFLIKSLTKMSARLSCCHIFVRYYRVFTRPEKSVRGAVKAGSESTKIFHVLPDVSVVTWMS